MGQTACNSMRFRNLKRLVDGKTRHLRLPIGQAGKSHAEAPKLWLRRNRRKRSFGASQENGNCHDFTTRDLDILRFLRWCRFVLAKDLADVSQSQKFRTLKFSA